MEKNEFLKYIPYDIKSEDIIDCSNLDEKTKKKYYYNFYNDFCKNIIGIPYVHIIDLGSDIDVCKIQEKIPYQIFHHNGKFYTVIENKMLLKEDKKNLVAKYPEFKSYNNIVTSWMGVTFYNTVEGKLNGY